MTRDRLPLWSDLQGRGERELSVSFILCGGVSLQMLVATDSWIGQNCVFECL
jgi:hypothetical protein